MYSANEARAKTPNKVEAYLSARIKESAEAGFSSTKAWMDSSSVEEAGKILESSGYKWEVAQVDAERSQLSITWSE